MPMTPAARSSLTDRTLDFLFGKRLEGEALDRFRASQPPAPVRWFFSALFYCWLAIVILWVAGVFGWLPVDRESFSFNQLLLINLVGLAMNVTRGAVRRRYERKAALAGQGSQTTL
ncbi:MAG: hypothetical protein EON96_09960 [Caulobacteraceae bacterium]|nr:MAG: hypothetical protein EON96_09960 [Caulobacteraceae bacterium]